MIPSLTVLCKILFLEINTDFEALISLYIGCSIHNSTINAYPVLVNNKVFFDIQQHYILPSIVLSQTIFSCSIQYYAILCGLVSMITLQINFMVVICIEPWFWCLIKRCISNLNIFPIDPFLWKLNLGAHGAGAVL